MASVLNDNCGLVTVVMCLAMAWSLLGAVEKKINEKKDRVGGFCWQGESG